MRDWLNLLWYRTAMSLRDLAIALTICIGVILLAFILVFLLELKR